MYVEEKREGEVKAPEVGSKEHILQWLASKPADQEYYWLSCQSCAAGQYMSEFNYSSLKGTYYLAEDWDKGTLNKLAYELPWTFGALYQRALAAWK